MAEKRRSGASKDAGTAARGKTPPKKAATARPAAGARKAAAPPPPKAAKAATRVASAKPARGKKPAAAIAKPPVEAASETIVAAAKFATGVSDAPATNGPREALPDTYEQNRLTLLVRDPQTLFAHWDVSPSWGDEMKARVGGRSLATAPFTLRLTPAGTGASQDFHISRKARSSYVTVAPGSAYAAEIGVTSAAGEFHLIARSAVVALPPAAPSRETRRPEVRRFSEARAIAIERKKRRPATEGLRLPRRRPAAAAAGAARDARLGVSSARLGAEPFGGASDVHRR